MSVIGLFGFGKTNLFAAGTTIIYRPLKFEREKGTEKSVRSAMLKTIRIKGGGSRIRLIWPRDVPVIAAVVRGGISLLRCQGLATNANV